MKIENIDRANTLVGQIKAKELLLNQLNGEKVTILIKSGKNVVMNIQPDDEIKLNTAAENILTEAKNLVKNEIISMKGELETL